jgi:para-nitrobenzyl esterase
MDWTLAMMEYWVSFAKTGNPNNKGLPEWPSYTIKSDINLEFSDDSHLNQRLFMKENDFISRQFTAIFMVCPQTQ